MQLIFLTYIVPCSILLPLVAYLVYRPETMAAGILFFYLLVSASINLAGLLLARAGHSNLWLLHVYTIIETVLLLLFFARINKDSTVENKDRMGSQKPAQQRGSAVQRFINIMLIVFPLAGIINLLVFQPVSRFNTYPRSFEALIFFFLSIYYWLKEPDHKQVAWTENPYNWMVSGLVLYFASSFLLFLFSNFLLAHANSTGDSRAMDICWTMHASLVMIMYLLFTIGFYQCRRQETISII